jgi:uncharacterized Zn finger protein (UPF0148 family)
MKVKIECPNCDIVYSVLYEVREPICFCPFCGEEIVTEEDDDDFEKEVDDSD